MIDEYSRAQKKKKDLGRVSYPDSEPVFLPGSGFQISLDQHPVSVPRSGS